MTDKICPLLLFSSPRAGSTLLQRMLASHEQVATTAEPWILLPLLYTLQDEGVMAEYGHKSVVRAVRDMYSEMPGGVDDYLAEMGQFVSRLYQRMSPEGTRYFLDKTPRYAFVASDAFRLFPEGKFIFLWRNPLATAASIIETWGPGKGKWRIYPYGIDLMSGLLGLTEAFEKFGSRAIVVQYEQLVQQPEEEIRRVCDYLDMTFDPQMISGFSKVDLQGKMGDPTGRKEYKQVSLAPLEKWKRTFNNPLRKRWARKYLRQIGEHRLGQMGYDMSELLAEVDSIGFSTRHVVSDIFRIRLDGFKSAARQMLLRHQWRGKRRPKA